MTLCAKNRSDSLAGVSVPVVWPVAAAPAGQHESWCSLVELLPVSPAGLLPAASHNPDLLPKPFLQADARPVDVITA